MTADLVRRLQSARFVRFAAVGAIGFAIDGGLLTILTSWGRIDVFASRLVSFSAAVAVTWALNRTFVFCARAGPVAVNKGAEYARYLTVQICGAASNLAVFWLLIWAFPNLREMPILPLCFGAALGLMINYAGSRYWVFHPA